MENKDLVDWLIECKGMTSRSAKDVLSRYGRVCKILNVEMLDDNSSQELIDSKKYIESSMFIKSQLKRTITLYLEYKKYKIKEESLNGK